jgi:hypothetical protein
MNLLNDVSPFYPVLRNQLFTQFQEADVYVFRDALLNADSGQILGTVSPNYKLLLNEEVDAIFAEAFSDLPIVSARDHMNWKQNRWQRDFILDGDQFNIDVGGSIVKTKVSIFNGYDGKSSVGFTVAAYRENGEVTYLNNMFTQTYSHVQRGLVARIREDFAAKLQLFQDTAQRFRDFDQASFTAVQFESFINGLIREGDRDRQGYLSQRQADAILASYRQQFNALGVRQTRFGAYTVLSAIATERQGRGGSSPIFTAGHKRIEKVVQDFFFDSADIFTI